MLGDVIPSLVLIKQDADLSINTPSSSTSSSDDGSGFGIAFDKYYKRVFRFNVTGSYVGYDAFDVAKITVSADYLVPMDNRVAFFGGAAAGGVIQKYNDASLTDAALGLEYGLQLGVIGSISKGFMLEGGYRFRPTDITTNVAGTASTTVNVESLNELYFSVLMMF